MEGLDLTLVKTKTYKDLKPYGKFTVKWKTRQGNLPHILPIDELDMYHETSFPLTEEQDKEVIKFMKKHKTDILTDGSYFGFYTRTGTGFTMVRHKKLLEYRDNEGFKELVDNR